VTDVDAEYDRLVRQAGLTPELTPRTEDLGQRHFIVVAPGGVLIDVITPAPPTSDYAELFTLHVIARRPLGKSAGRMTTRPMI
jgi:hypothetical protein